MKKKKTKKDDINKKWHCEVFYTTITNDENRDKLNKLKLSYQKTIENYEERIETLTKLRTLEIANLRRAIEGNIRGIKALNTQLLLSKPPKKARKKKPNG